MISWLGRAVRNLPDIKAFYRELKKMVHSMAIILAFDAYGTLIDTHGIAIESERYAGTWVRDCSRLCTINS